MPNEIADIQSALNSKHLSPIPQSKSRTNGLILGSNYQLSNTGNASGFGALGRSLEHNNSIDNASPTINPYSETINVRTGPALLMVVNQYRDEDPFSKKHES
jgi:hypothetical protein